MKNDDLHRSYVSLWFRFGPENRPVWSINEMLLMYRVWLLVAGDRTMNYVCAQR